MELEQGMTRKRLVEEILKIGTDDTPVHFMCGVTGEPFPYPHIEPAEEVDIWTTRSGKTFQEIEDGKDPDYIVLFMED